MVSKLIKYLGFALAGLLALAGPAFADCTGQFQPGQFCGNANGVMSDPNAWAPSPLFDTAFGSNAGTLLNRGAGGWSATINPVLGNPGSSVGTLGFGNLTSGTVTLSPPTGALGSAILTLPDVTDTLTANAAPQTLTNKTLISPLINGGTITGTAITGLASPVNASDAANKQYVDNAANGLVVHTAAVLATTAALPTNTYNNGSSGVGATLTATANAALTVDGVVVSLNNRVVVKNEAAATNNGIYSVTQVGDATHPYILTRTTDANTPGVGNPNEIGMGTYVFISSGTANTGSAWIVNSTVTTIGTSAISWVQFSSQTSTLIDGTTVINGGVNGTTLINNSGVLGHSTFASSVSNSDGSLTISPTSGAVIASCALFGSAQKGCVPGSGGGTTNFLRADGSWAAPVSIIQQGVTSITSATASNELLTTGTVSGGTGVITNVPFVFNSNFLTAPAAGGYQIGSSSYELLQGTFNGNNILGLYEGCTTVFCLLTPSQNSALVIDQEFDNPGTYWDGADNPAALARLNMSWYHHADLDYLWSTNDQLQPAATSGGSVGIGGTWANGDTVSITISWNTSAFAPGVPGAVTISCTVNGTCGAGTSNETIATAIAAGIHNNTTLFNNGFYVNDSQAAAALANYPSAGLDGFGYLVSWQTIMAGFTLSNGSTTSGGTVVLYGPFNELDGPIGHYIERRPPQVAAFTASQSGSVLSINSVTSGCPAPNQRIFENGFAETILSRTSGAVCGTGNFNVSGTGTVGAGTTWTAYRAPQSGDDVASVSWLGSTNFNPAGGITLGRIDVFQNDPSVPSAWMTFQTQCSGGGGASNGNGCPDMTIGNQVVSVGALANFNSNLGHPLEVWMPGGTGGNVMSMSGNVDETASVTLLAETSGGANANLELRGSTVFAFGTASNGACSWSGSGTSWSCSSDSRIKQDKTELGALSSLWKIAQLTPITYQRIGGDESLHDGFTAQDVRQQFPELVSQDESRKNRYDGKELTPDGELTLEYTGLIAPIVRSVQTLSWVTVLLLLLVVMNTGALTVLFYKMGRRT